MASAAEATDRSVGREWRVTRRGEQKERNPQITMIISYSPSLLQWPLNVDIVWRELIERLLIVVVGSGSWTRGTVLSALPVGQQIVFLIPVLLLLLLLARAISRRQLISAAARVQN